MAPGTRSPYLGPHVVGQRVVVRRLVAGKTGPTGGPAFTDVLGTCLAWDPCVVEKADGTRVTIPVAEIVSGKPVPPRPSVRLRATVAECESHVAGLWPSVATQALGGWTLRHAADVDRRRANSCLAVDEPGLVVTEALEGVIDFYGARGRPPLVAVERDSAVEASVAGAGWRPAGGDSSMLLASVSRLLRSAGSLGGAVDGRVEVAGTADSASATVGDGDSTTARAHAVLDGDWLGLRDLHVAPDARRRGHARELVLALAEWGAERGARTLWLHVEDDNLPARGLYDALGFDLHHRMRYLAPPAS